MTTYNAIIWQLFPLIVKINGVSGQVMIVTTVNNQCLLGSVLNHLELDKTGEVTELLTQVGQFMQHN